MKKFTLFLFASLFSALSFAALNPYAYGLSSTLDGTTLKVNYSLNAPATAVSVVIMDGETEVKTIACDGKTTKGSHTVEISTLDFPTGKSLTWKVEVKGTSVASPTLQSDVFNFYLPYGLDCDVDPESDYLGNWYVIEAATHTKTGYVSYNVQRGLYAFDATLTGIKNKNGTYGFTGGMTLGATETNNASTYVNLYRTATSGGRIFVARFRSGYAPVLEATDIDSGDYPLVLKSAQGRAVAIDVRGQGENLELMMLTKDFQLKRYDLGIATSATDASKTTDLSEYVIRDDASMVYDADGGVWINQHRGGTDKPTIVHVSSEGVVDFDNLTAGVSHIGCNNSGIAINPAGTELAVVGAGAQKLTIYAISKEAEGKIALTKKYTISTSGSNHTALSYDYAGNLYVANRSKETITFYAMPYSGTVSTPCASKYAFEVEEVAATVYTLTTNVVGEGAVEGNVGSYVAGTTAKLTATPAEHYDFLNWTYGSETSTDNPLIITVNSDMTITANFQAHTKYTITAVPNDEDMGTVTGGREYYVGESATLKATAKSGYVFVGWTDGEKNATRTVTVSGDATYTANFQAIAPRAWAYDLKVVEDGDNYKFTFNATTAGTATLLFTDIDGNPVAPTSHDVDPVAVGANTVLVAKASFTENKDVYWSVKMDGEAIPAISEITDASKGIYNFYLPQGVAVDNNPESSTFSKIYIAESTDGASDGGSDRADNQKRGIFIYDQTLAELNPTNKGIIPSNVTLTNTTRNALKRIAINPKTNEVAFAYNASPAAVWAVSTENVAGEATNLLAGLGFDYCNSLCFDENGILYIFDNGAGYPAKGSLYKIVNGEKHTIFSENSKYGNADNSLASDGRGGLWISQNRGQLDGFNQLSHINANGEIDFEVNSTTPHDFASLNTSRGAMAYNPRENILAIGIGASGAIGVSLYQVTYDPSTGVPSLEYIGATPSLGTNVEGIAFDYAGDLYALSANKERFYKFTLPTDENICTVPAPSSQKLVLGTQCEVTVTVNDPAMGSVEGAGQYEKGAEVTLTPNPVAHHRFVDWTGDKTSTENPLKFTIEGDVNLTANFEAIPQITITVTSNDDNMGTVSGSGTYDEGQEVTIAATAKTSYRFVKWNDDVTDATRTFPAAENLTLQAIFEKVPNRAWAYDLSQVADGDNYKFSFVATTAGEATLLFADKDGNELVAPYTVGTVAAGANTVTLAKTTFASVTKDVYWSVKMDGEAIASVAEITDPTRNIYDFYNMMGVVVDNDPNSDEFGKIYIQQSYNGASDGIADRSDTQKAGIFIYNQALEELNSPANTGIKPQLPYTIGANRQVFKRITINPANGDIAFCNNTTTNGGAYAVSRENLAGEAINLTKHISDIQKVNALCFDEEGNLYVAANVSTSGAPNGNIYQIKTDGTYTELTSGSLFYDQEIAMASDGRGGLWIAQNRWGTAAGTLFHVNVAENKIDFKVEADKDYSDWFAGANYRGAIAYDKQRDILAVHSQACASVFQVTYAADGTPSISKICQTPNLGRNELDGLAFDYAGDLYVVHSGTERFYKYVLPTNDNTCTVPAPASQKLVLGTQCEVTVTVNDPAMGSVEGAGQYEKGTEVTLTATANASYRFVNWTYGGETSTDNPLLLVVEDNITVTANFEPLPEIAYELNGGVWNKYGWTSKKDMYNALLDDWRAYSGSTRTNVTYETQLGIGNSSKGIPTTITSVDDRVAFWNLFADATYAPKWGWLATYVDAVAATQYKKMDVAQGVKTQPTSAAGVFTFTIGNFFGEDNAHSTDYIDAVDFTGEEAHITAFAPYWGQTFPMPTQPTEEVVLNAPYKEGYLFEGWYAAPDFSGAEITVVDETTNGTLYAKWLEHFYTRTVTNGRYGTICLPYGSRNMTGAIFYEVAYLNESTMRVFVDEVTELEAGKPYIFMATSNLIKVLYQGEEAISPDNYNGNGLYGTFEAISDGAAGAAGNELEGNYMLSNNQIIKCLGNCKLPAYRAYIKLDEISTTEPALMPGRRRVALGVQGGNEATGLDNLTEDGIAPAMEGTYDVLGRKMNEPNNTGFYIVNGKKVVIVK